MKLQNYSQILLLVIECPFIAGGQKRIASAIVIDERLSLLRMKPSLFANSAQRMRRGRRVQVISVAENDGVKFFKVSAPPRVGWVQSEALLSRTRPGDEERLIRLVIASNGFEQVELATMFFELYPASKFRPSMLLLYGDILESAAVKLSRDARSRLDQREIAASGAPLHSYYLNFSLLDRYRRIGVTFMFEQSTRSFHYNGASWNEIVKKYPTSAEAFEAEKRLRALKAKMEQPE